MQTERPTRDLQAAELLHDDHRRLKSEMAARAEDFQQLTTMADEMIRGGHYAETEVRNFRVRGVSQTRIIYEKDKFAEDTGAFLRA